MKRGPDRKWARLVARPFTRASQPGLPTWLVVGQFDTDVDAHAFAESEAQSRGVEHRVLVVRQELRFVPQTVVEVVEVRK